MDRILIRDLTVECVIGTRADERVRKQKLIVGLALDVDLATAGRTDELGDTVNYSRLRDDVVALAEGSQFFLIERLADRVAECCLRDRRVAAVRVTVDKPEALPGARSVAVEIERSRGGTE